MVFLPNTAPESLLFLLQTQIQTLQPMLECVETVATPQTNTKVLYLRSFARGPVASRDFIVRQTTARSSSGILTLTSEPSTSIHKPSPPSVIRASVWSRWTLTPRGTLGTDVEFDVKLCMNGWIPNVVNTILAQTEAQMPLRLAEMADKPKSAQPPTP